MHYSKKVPPSVRRCRGGANGGTKNAHLNMIFFLKRLAFVFAPAVGGRPMIRGNRNAELLLTGRLQRTAQFLVIATLTLKTSRPNQTKIETTTFAIVKTQFKRFYIVDMTLIVQTGPFDIILQ